MKLCQLKNDFETLKLKLEIIVWLRNSFTISKYADCTRKKR